MQFENAIITLYGFALITTLTSMNYIGFGLLIILLGLTISLKKQIANIRQLIIDWQNREINRIKYEQD
jgi:hypothetical protein